MAEHNEWSLHSQPNDCMGGDEYKYSIWCGDRIVLMADIAPNPLNSEDTLEGIVEACNNFERLTRDNKRLRKALKALDSLLDFGDEEVDNIWIFVCIDGIQEAFKQARAALSLKKRP
jgi:hypothetical protein